MASVTKTWTDGEDLNSTDLNQNFTDLVDEFDTSTGHDHDGTDSKKISAIQNVWNDTDGTDNSTNSTSYTDTTMSITQTTGANKCLILFSAGAKLGTGAFGDLNESMGIKIFVDAVEVAAFNGSNRNENSDWQVALTGLTSTLTAASHTFKVQFKTSNGSYTATLRGSVETTRLTVIELRT